MLPDPTLNSYLMLAAVLFAIGAAGVFLQRRFIGALLALQVMLNGVALTFVAAGRYFGGGDGQIHAVATVGLALVQAMFGLAIVVTLVRRRLIAAESVRLP